MTPKQIILQQLSAASTVDVYVLLEDKEFLRFYFSLWEDIDRNYDDIRELSLHWIHEHY